MRLSDIEYKFEAEFWKKISGEKYYWKKTMRPEISYNYDYSKTLTMKILLSIPDNKGRTIVVNNFEDTLEIIKKINNLTYGIKKILYLVGWQYNGHDDGYPAFFKVNEALKRKEDKTARDSILWLADEAKKYNTTISVHINFTDAYKESPIWEEYIEKELISRNKTGTLKKTGTWNGRTAYQVCYKKEWESGYFVKRIKKLIELLPFLLESKTLHADAFFARPNPYYRISIQEEERYMRKIYRYLSSLGIDLTSEFFNAHRKHEKFIGLQPMVWWYDAKISDYLKYPANLICGGKPNPDLPFVGRQHKRAGFLFGMSAHGEGAFSFKDPKDGKIKKRPDWEHAFKEEFYLNFPQFYFLNQFKRLMVKGWGKKKIAHFSDNIEVSLKQKTVKQREAFYRKDSDIFFPIKVYFNNLENRSRTNYNKKFNAILSYSKKGYNNKKWILPYYFQHYNKFKIKEITENGLKPFNSIEYLNKKEDNKIELSLAPNQAVLIEPVIE